jgi:riboflavin synthase
MFTGIIETTGIITDIYIKGNNKTFWIGSSLAPELQIDQSLAHDGVCLTVEELSSDKHRVTAVAETLEKTCLDEWTRGKTINLERCMTLNGRLDGHIVQGHVDTTGIIKKITEQNGSWLYNVSFPPSFASLVIEKGSITVNGISLTAFDVTTQSLQVAIIPYTYEHTTIKHLKAGDKVNLEFDVIGKYVSRYLQVRN